MNPCILVVDDDAQIRDALHKVLVAEGYEVCPAADGDEAIRLFSQREIGMLLLDLNLPDTNGWETFERLTSANPCLPVVVITGREHQFEVADAAGAGALFEKPLDVPQLLQTIRELLRETPEQRLERITRRRGPVRLVRPRHP